MTGVQTCALPIFSVASASSGKGRHMSLEGLMLVGSGHKLVFTLTVIVSASVGQEGPGSSGCQARLVVEGHGGPWVSWCDDEGCLLREGPAPDDRSERCSSSL